VKSVKNSECSSAFVCRSLCQYSLIKFYSDAWGSFPTALCMWKNGGAFGPLAEAGPPPSMEEEALTRASSPSDSTGDGEKRVGLGVTRLTPSIPRSTRILMLPVEDSKEEPRLSQRRPRRQLSQSHQRVGRDKGKGKAVTAENPDNAEGK